MKTLMLCGCILACIFYISAEIISRRLPMEQNRGEEFVNYCLNEVGLTQQEAYGVHDIINEEYKQPGMEEKKRKHGCVIECLLKKLQWMEGSKIMEQRIYGNVTKLLMNNPMQENVQELVRNCAAEVRDTTEEKCEKGFTVITCIVKHIQEWGFIETFDLLSEEEGNEN